MVKRSWFVVAPLVLGLGGCGDDAAGGAPSGGGGSGAAGANGSGAEGSGAAAGGGAGPCVEDATTCVRECPDQALVDLFEPCPSEVCGQPSRCVDPAIAGISEEQSSLLADCPDGKKCVPELFIATFNQFDLVNCSSVKGFEGRCLSACLPPVAAQAGFLPDAGCQPGELCTPCYDPFTGEPTGACGLSCDEPPLTAAEENVFKPCCQNKAGGHCLPLELVGEQAAKRFDKVECEGLGEAGTVCVPDIVYEQVAAQGFFQGAPCELDILIIAKTASDDAACLPRCIPEVEEQSVMIEMMDTSPFTIDLQSNCPDGFACLPCTDQTIPTGACEPQGV